MKKLFLFILILILSLNLSGCYSIGSVVRGYIDDVNEEPKQKYGEFPFELVCEIDGEEFTFKDTLVITHSGEKTLLASGEYNVWLRSFLNSSVKVFEGKNEILLKRGYKYLVGDYEITFFLGTCNYYMGMKDPENSYKMFNISPGDIMISSEDYTKPIDEETLYEEYNIKIIKKSISEPLPDNVK